MRKHDGRRLKGALKGVALSADVLWRHQYVWMEEARRSTNTCLNFPTMGDNDMAASEDDKASIDCEDGSSTKSDVMEHLYLEEHKNRFLEVSSKDDIETKVVSHVAPTLEAQDIGDSGKKCLGDITNEANGGSDGQVVLEKAMAVVISKAPCFAR